MGPGALLRATALPLVGPGPKGPVRGRTTHRVARPSSPRGSEAHPLSRSRPPPASVWSVVHPRGQLPAVVAHRKPVSELEGAIFTKGARPVSSPAHGSGVVFCTI